MEDARDHSARGDLDALFTPGGPLQMSFGRAVAAGAPREQVEAFVARVLDADLSSSRWLETTVLELFAGPARSAARTVVENRVETARGWAALFDVSPSSPAWVEGEDPTIGLDLATAVATAIHRSASEADAKGSASAVEEILGAVHRSLIALSAGPDGVLYAGARAEGIVAIASADGSAVIGWVGRVRAVLVRDGRARALTVEHTLLDEAMADRAARGDAMRPEEIAAFPYPDVVTRVLGSEQAFRPGLFSLQLRPGDRLVLTSRWGRAPTAALPNERFADADVHALHAMLATRVPPGFPVGLCVLDYRPGSRRSPSEQTDLR